MTHFIRASVANRMAMLAAVPLVLAICLFMWQVRGGTDVFAQTGSDDAVLTSCTASPENPRSGDTVTLSARVENVSAGDTRADLYVGFSFNDARTGSVGTEPEFVAKGGSFTFTRTVDAGGIHLPVGTNTVECYLIWFDNGRNHDMDRTGPGRRLPNATVTVLASTPTPTVQAAIGNAILTSCTASPENPRSGDTVALSAQVENVSAGDTRADLYVGFSFNDARTGSVGTEPEFVAKGSSATFTRTVDAGGSNLPVGTNTVECYLIWFDNGRNHDMDRTGPGRRLPNATVTVLASTPTPTPTPTNTPVPPTPTPTNTPVPPTPTSTNTPVPPTPTPTYTPVPPTPTPTYTPVPPGIGDAVLTSCMASPENPDSGDTVILSARVENVSAGDTRADLYVGFSFNDARTGSVRTKPEFVAKGGSATFTATADAGGNYLPVGTNIVECYLIWFDNGLNHDMDRTGSGRRLPNATVNVMPTPPDTPTPTAARTPVPTTPTPMAIPTPVPPTPTQPSPLVVAGVIIGLLSVLGAIVGILRSDRGFRNLSKFLESRLGR